MEECQTKRHRTPRSPAPGSIEPDDGCNANASKYWLTKRASGRPGTLQEKNKKVGFQHILIADGHGSNMPILELAGRPTILETQASCGAFIWPALAADVTNSLRQSEKPGGMSHVQARDFGLSSP